MVKDNEKFDQQLGVLLTLTQITELGERAKKMGIGTSTLARMYIIETLKKK